MKAYIFCILLLLGGLTLPSLAATPLQLYVDNVEVSESNAANVLKGQGEGRDGCVSFDYKTYTLILRGAKLTNSIKITGERPDQLITVQLEGKNEIITKNWAFQIFSPVLIQGSGSLYIRSSGRYARGFSISGMQDELYLKISKTTVRVEAVNDSNDGEALFSPVKREGYVIIEDANFSSIGLVAGMKELYLQGCDIVNKDQVYLGQLNDNWGYTCAVIATISDDKLNYGLLQIAPDQSYPIAIGQTQVTRDNASDILASTGTSGSASYDPKSNTLYLKNLVLDTNLENGIFSRFAPIDKTLTIDLEGNVELHSKLSGMLLFGNTCIQGSGSIKVYADDGSQDYGGILIADKDTLTVRDCHLFASGPFALGGIRLQSRLLIDNATLELTCTNKTRGATIEGFDALVLQRVSFINPQGVRFDANLCGATTDGVTLCKEPIQIARANSVQHTRPSTPSISTSLGQLSIGQPASPMTIKVYTLLGELIYEQLLTRQVTIPLHSGVYILELGLYHQTILIP